MSTGDFNHLPEVMKAIHDATRKAVTKAALDVEGKAKQWAPVDTGFLRASIYSITPSGSDYARASTGAARKDEFKALLPEVPAPENDTTAIVAVGASYGEYVEYGTRHMAAQPFLMPSFDVVKGALNKVFARLIAAEIKAYAKGSSE